MTEKYDCINLKKISSGKNSQIKSKINHKLGKIFAIHRAKS